MLSSLMGTTIVRYRYPLITDHGTQAYDYTQTPDTLAIPGTSVQPQNGVADLVNRDGASEPFTVYASPDADIQKDDILGIRGKNYRVTGVPLDWEGLSLSHMQLSVVRWYG